MGTRCQGGLSDSGVTMRETPKECTPSRADPGSLSLESAVKSNKDMLTDHFLFFSYYSQVKILVFCKYLWGKGGFWWYYSTGCSGVEKVTPISGLTAWAAMLLKSIPSRTLSCDRNLPVAAPCCTALAQVLRCVGHPVLLPKWAKWAEHKDNTALYYLWSWSTDYLALSWERAWEHLGFWHTCVWRRGHFWNCRGPTVRTLWSRKHGQRGPMAHHEAGRALSLPE